jgi:hypothetical protein
MTSADHERNVCAQQLWQRVSELVVTVVEDRPAGADLAAVDDLCDSVTELQGAVWDVVRAFQSADRGESIVTGCELLHATTLLLWRDLIAGRRLAAVATSARRRGVDLRPWLDSTRVAVETVADPLIDTIRAQHTFVREYVDAMRSAQPDKQGNADQPRHNAAGAVSPTTVEVVR